MTRIYKQKDLLHISYIYKAYNLIKFFTKVHNTIPR